MNREIASAIQIAGRAVSDGLVRCGKTIGDAITAYTAFRAVEAKIAPDEVTTWIDAFKRPNRSR